MDPNKLTVRNIRARPVRVPLKRPIVSRVGLFRDWPMILIDLETNEGVVGRSYLEPYLESSARYIVPMIDDLARALAGKPVAPFDVYRSGIGALHLVGREGLTLIAVSGIDMAAWDALAQAGVKRFDMPASQLRLWKAIREAKAGRPEALAIARELRGPLARPAHIWVYDFVATAGDLPSDSPLAGEADVDTSPQTAEQIAQAKALLDSGSISQAICRKCAGRMRCSSFSPRAVRPPAFWIASRM